MEEYTYTGMGNFRAVNEAARLADWQKLINNLQQSIQRQQGIQLGSRTTTIANDPVKTVNLQDNSLQTLFSGLQTTAPNGYSNTATQASTNTPSYTKPMTEYEQQKIKLMTRQQDTFEALQDRVGLFQSIGSVANLGLGIWNAIEQAENSQKSRELADEQIAASREARQQRKDEIERLNKVRGNTSKRFASSAQISRSY